MSRFQFISVETVGADTVVIECAKCCFTDEQYAAQARDEMYQLMDEGRHVLIIRLHNARLIHCTFTSRLLHLKKRLGDAGRLILCEVANDLLPNVEPLKQHGIRITDTKDQALAVAV